MKSLTLTASGMNLMVTAAEQCIGAIQLPGHRMSIRLSLIQVMAIGFACSCLISLHLIGCISPPALFPELSLKVITSSAVKCL